MPRPLASSTPRRTTRSTASWKNLLIRRACPTHRRSRTRRWATTSSVGTPWSRHSSQTPSPLSRVMTWVATSSRDSSRPGTRRSTTSVTTRCPEPPRRIGTTGGTWEPSMPTTTRTWTSCRWNRSSTSTTPTGRSGASRNRRRGRNSSCVVPATTPWSPPGASSRAPTSTAPCWGREYASNGGPGSMSPSS